MNEIEDAIYDALAAETSLTSLVGTRIYRGEATSKAAHPLVKIQLTGGGDVTETPADKIDCLYLVQGVSKLSAAQAGQISAAIRTALHKKTLTVSGWTNIWTACEGMLNPVELNTATGELSWHAGRFVRILLSK